MDRIDFFEQSESVQSALLGFGGAGALAIAAGIHFAYLRRRRLGLTE